MALATAYRGVLPVFGVPLRQVAARLVVRASAPQGMGRALAPVGALPPYLPRGFFTPSTKKNTQQRRERTERVQGEKTISPTRKKYFSN